MNYPALIEFNKYTIAVAAAAFAYGLEKVASMNAVAPVWLVAITLGMLLLASLLGAFVFAAATKELHSSPTGQGQRNPVIERVGSAHAIVLVVGLFLLGMVLFVSVFEPPASKTGAACCCD